MVFKKLKASLGLGGGATVETELAATDVRPGETVSGSIVVTGGELEQEVSFLEVALQAKVEVETDDSEYDANQTFHHLRVADAFTAEVGSERRFDFELQIPWETPFNVVRGATLGKVEIGVRTELEIARAIDSTDVDPIRVHALPVHDAVLAAVEQLGFGFLGADLEQGRIPGSQLPFFQEVEFRGSPRFSGINQLEVTFLTGPSSTDVILEVDRRGGFLSEGTDAIGRLTVGNEPHGELAGVLEEAIADLGRKRGLFG